PPISLGVLQIPIPWSLMPAPIVLTAVVDPKAESTVIAPEALHCAGLSPMLADPPADPPVAVNEQVYAGSIPPITTPALLIPRAKTATLGDVESRKVGALVALHCATLA